MKEGLGKERPLRIPQWSRYQGINREERLESQKHKDVGGTRFGFGNGTDAKGGKSTKSTILEHKRHLNL